MIAVRHTEEYKAVAMDFIRLSRSKPHEDLVKKVRDMINATKELVKVSFPGPNEKWYRHLMITSYRI